MITSLLAQHLSTFVLLFAVFVKWNETMFESERSWLPLYLLLSHAVCGRWIATCCSVSTSSCSWSTLPVSRASYTKDQIFQQTWSRCSEQNLWSLSHIFSTSSEAKYRKKGNNLISLKCSVCLPLSAFVITFTFPEKLWSVAFGKVGLTHRRMGEVRCISFWTSWAVSCESSTPGDSLLLCSFNVVEQPGEEPQITPPTPHTHFLFIVQSWLSNFHWSLAL